jgi:hypothetical protein
MRARLKIHVPFTMIIPENVEFVSSPYDLDGCIVVNQPPLRLGDPSNLGAPRKINIDGLPAYEADIVQIDFFKESFKRVKGQGFPDPSSETQLKAVNNFIRRLRYVTKAAALQPITENTRSSRLEYTNDDGSPLERDERLIRTYVATAQTFSYALIIPEVWRDAESLGPDFQAPIWDELRLDSERALPHIGTSIALTAISLERFITDVIGQLAKAQAKPDGLWGWVVDREDLKKPTVEEMFDPLLKIFTGHSLKEELNLWEAMKDIKNARNRFVHDGIPRVGKNSPPLTFAQALSLIVKSREIVAKIRSWLSQELQWIEFTYPAKQIDVQLIAMMLGPQGNAAPETTEFPRLLSQGDPDSETKKKD